MEETVTAILALNNSNGSPENPETEKQVTGAIKGLGFKLMIVTDNPEDETRELLFGREINDPHRG